MVGEEVCLSSHGCERTSAMGKFPVELWIEVFRNISHPQRTGTLAHIMHVNKHFCTIAEEQLYHTVSLMGLERFSKFRLSLDSSPHRALLVHDIRLLRLKVDDSPIPDIFPPFLISLRNLRSLKLTQPFGSYGTPYCDALSTVQIPHLRSLSIDMDPSPCRCLDFLEAHADRLEELQITFTIVTFQDIPLLVARLAVKKFPALRVLECPTLFLGGHPHIPVPPNLTHLSRPTAYGWELPIIAQRIGSQLVSLTLDSVWLDDQSREEGPPSWSLVDVQTKFPRLRYLQIEEPYTRTYSVVDWFPDKPLEHTGTKIPVHRDGAAPHSTSRLTIAWLFDSVFLDERRVPEQRATENAVRILTSSGGYVERVLLNRASRWICVRLGADSEVQGERQVIKEETLGDMDRYWAQV